MPLPNRFGALATHRRWVLGRVAGALAMMLPDVRVFGVEALGIAPAALKTAAVAVLGLLHLDHVPANATAASAARLGTLNSRLGCELASPRARGGGSKAYRDCALAAPCEARQRTARIAAQRASPDTSLQPAPVSFPSFHRRT